MKAADQTRSVEYGCGTRLAIVSSTMGTGGTDARVLRWTFRRQHETVICQLGLNSDHSAYELRLNPPWDLQGISTETYDDAMPAFQRHAAIERILVDEGWLLEGFESTCA